MELPADIISNIILGLDSRDITTLMSVRCSCKQLCSLLDETLGSRGVRLFFTITLPACWTHLGSPGPARWVAEREKDFTGTDGNKCAGYDINFDKYKRRRLAFKSWETG